MKYWIASVSKEHGTRGESDGFIQVSHGRETPLRRIKKGDHLIIYSSKIKMDDTEKYQMFTAIGELPDDDIYAVKMSEKFIPYRRRMDYKKCRDAAIIPLIEQLEFIKNKKFWGYPFRYGLFEISQHDYLIIAEQMLVHEG